jgi:shikimate dehydrogenase
MTQTFLSELVGYFAMSAVKNPTVAIMEAAFKHHGLDWRYINCEVMPENLQHSVDGASAM